MSAPRVSRFEAHEALAVAMTRVDDIATRSGAPDTGKILVAVLDELGVDLDVRGVLRQVEDKSRGMAHMFLALMADLGVDIETQVASSYAMGVGEGLVLGLVLADQLDRVGASRG